MPGDVQEPDRVPLGERVEEPVPEAEPGPEGRLRRDVADRRPEEGDRRPDPEGEADEDELAN